MKDLSNVSHIDGTYYYGGNMGNGTNGRGYNVEAVREKRLAHLTKLVEVHIKSFNEGHNCSASRPSKALANSNT